MLARRFDDLATLVSRVLFPTLVARQAARDHVGFDRALVDTLRYLVILGLWVASVGAGASHAVMSMFGPGFLRASGALSLLLFLPPLMFAATTQTQGLYAVDRPGITSWFSGVRLLITTGVAIAATKAIGIEGPAIGLLAGAAFLVVANAVVLKPHLTLPLLDLWPVRQMVGLGSACALGFAVSRAIEDRIAGVAALPVALPIGSVVFAVVLVVVGGLAARDRERLGSILAKTPFAARSARRRASPAPAGVGTYDRSGK
jgi:O-antigen/teichoic acid export membrane protein